MIDPSKITNYNRTEYELQEFLLFCIVVAGKNSVIQAKKLAGFLTLSRLCALLPFEQIRFLCSIKGLENYLISEKMGQYTRISNAFRELAHRNPDLKTCTVEGLQSIPGIGPKTARFFLLHSRPNQSLAVLDTHILKWLSGQGHKVPKSTPSGKKYQEIEKLFLSLIPEGKTVADFDLEIWNNKSA